MKIEKIYRTKQDACTAVVQWLELSDRYPGVVQVKTSLTVVNQKETGCIRVLSGPEVMDFFYDERQNDED